MKCSECERLVAEFRNAINTHAYAALNPEHKQRLGDEMNKKSAALKKHQDTAHPAHPGLASTIIIAALQEGGGNRIDALQLLVRRGGETWIGTQTELSAIIAALQNAAIFESLDTVMDELQRDGQVVLNNISVSDEQLAALGLQDKKAA